MTDARPVLNQINLVVRDMDAMLDFYRVLGVDIAPPAEADPWAQHHRRAAIAGVDFDFDSTGFASQWNEGWTKGRTGPVVGFGFTTREAVDTTHARLVDAGYRTEQTPYDAFWGARYAVVVDPEGNSVGLMSPIDPARRSDAPIPPSPTPPGHG